MLWKHVQCPIPGITFLGSLGEVVLAVITGPWSASVHCSSRAYQGLSEEAAPATAWLQHFSGTP
jgi:hypothetical protein